MVENKLKDSIIELRNNGESVKKISELLNCSKSTVSYHINNEGLGGVHNRFIKMRDDELLNTLHQEKINTIIKLKKEGKTYKTIVSEVNISYDKVKQICRMFNINDSSHKIKFKNTEFIENIKSLYVKHGSLKKVAKLTGVSFEKVRDIINPPKRKKLTNTQRLKNGSKSVTKHRQNIKKMLVEYKGGKCELCGYNKSLSALTFHHINSNEKEFTVGGKNYSKEKMIKEADKCILVCQNCHCEIHENDRNNGELA